MSRRRHRKVTDLARVTQLVSNRFELGMQVRVCVFCALDFASKLPNTSELLDQLQGNTQGETVKPDINIARKDQMAST